MRRCVGLVATLALIGSQLAGQHAGQFEVGAFGAYTKYDPSFGLAQKAGGGARIGYFIADMIGVEGDLIFQSEYTVTPPSGTPTTLQPLIGSASLVVSPLYANQFMLYVLGGFSVLDFGNRAPYHFTDHAGHVGAGVRLFLTERIALRVEGRAIYTPSTQATFGPTNVKHYLATVGLSVFHRGRVAAAPPTQVAQKVVKCPNPPAGAKLDAEGCPLPVDTVPAPPPAAPAPAVPPPPADTVAAPPPAAPPPPADTVAAPPPAPAPTPAPQVVERKCPPAPPGSLVDESGCLVLFAPDSVRPAAPGAPPRPTLVLRGVNFVTGSSRLTRDSYVILDAVAASLMANPEIRIEVAGYTDSTGRKFTNMRLSQSRATAVRFYLARKGVVPARMVSKGYGASNYIAPNSSTEGRAQNRRVELHKLP